MVRDGHAVVELRDRRWLLAPGGELGFGRSRGCPVRVGHEPEDRHVSRRAGTLRVTDSYVLVRNDSATQVLDLLPPTGLGRRLEPGEAATSLPYRRITVAVPGGYGRRYEITVDAGGLRVLFRPPEVPADRSGGGTVGADAAVSLTPAQRRALVALCEPMTGTSAGQQPAAASYRQVGLRLDRRPAYVRNVLRAVRETVAAAGVPGLLSDDDGSGPDEDFRLPLALWALRTGVVTRADVERLPPAGPIG